MPYIEHLGLPINNKQLNESCHAFVSCIHILTPCYRCTARLNKMRTPTQILLRLPGKLWMFHHSFGIWSVGTRVLQPFLQLQICHKKGRFFLGCGKWNYHCHHFQLETLMFSIFSTCRTRLFGPKD